MNMNNQMNMNAYNQSKLTDSMYMTGIFMDENALRIKNIIKPYEEKIKQLEEILRKKEFEIIILKDKLKTYKKNMMNKMNNNIMNPINNNNLMNSMDNNMMNSMNNNMMNPMNNNMMNPIYNNMMNPMNNNMMNPMDNNMMNPFDNNMMNPLMGKNMINQMMEKMMINPININENNNIINSNNKISIHFRFKVNEKTEIITIKCSYKEKFMDVINKIKPKIKHKIKNFKNIKFIYNAKSVHPNLTLCEAGIIDNANIFIVTTRGVNGPTEENQENNESSDSNSQSEEQDDSSNIINVNFNSDYGTNIVMNFKDNITIEEALKFYLERFDLNNDEQYLIFICNGSLIKVDDKRLLKEYFREKRDIYNIFVKDNHNLMGA